MLDQYAHTEERFMAPLIRSSSQCPGTMRAATSGGRRLMLVMLVMLGMPPLRAVPRVRGKRALWLSTMAGVWESRRFSCVTSVER